MLNLAHVLCIGIKLADNLWLIMKVVDNVLIVKYHFETSLTNISQYPKSPIFMNRVLTSLCHDLWECGSQTKTSIMTYIILVLYHEYWHIICIYLHQVTNITQCEFIFHTQMYLSLTLIPKFALLCLDMVYVALYSDNKMY